RRLMDQCLQRARARGFRLVRLDTERTMHAALHLYRTSGFREIPDYNGNPRAHIWMQLELEPRPVKETRTMATATVHELRKKSDAAFATVSRQLHGMEPHLERSDAAGEWTTRQVLCHLLFESGWKPVPVLQSFADHDLPVIDIKPGLVDMTAERRAMTLSQ